MWYLSPSIYLLDLLQSTWNSAARMIPLLPHQMSCTHLMSTSMELDAHAPERGVVHLSSPLWYRATSLHSMVSSWFSLFPKYLAWSSSLLHGELATSRLPRASLPRYTWGPSECFFFAGSRAKQGDEIIFWCFSIFLTIFFSLKKIYLVFFQLMKKLFHGRKKKGKKGFWVHFSSIHYLCFYWGRISILHWFEASFFLESYQCLQ